MNDTNVGTRILTTVCFKAAVGFLLLVFGIQGFAPDEHRSSTEPNSGVVMSLFNKRSDVKNHLSPRHHKKDHENRPLSQPDVPIIAPIESDAIKANSSDCAEDFNAEQSSFSPSIVSNDGLTSSVNPQPPLRSKSVRE